MPRIDNNGVPIHYEIEGNGPPLVLHHGSFGSLEDWREFGYVAALRDRHQLILLDARGHGSSGKPHDQAAYDLQLRASDVTAVLDALGIQTADFMGYSMGGWIGFGLAKCAPQRFRSLILGGAHPFAEDMTAFRAMLPTEPDAFLALVAPAFGEHLLPGVRQRLVANDLRALTALTTDRMDFSDVLPTMRMPCLLYAGTADPRLEKMEECARRMPNVTFFSLPGQSHVGAFGHAALVLPHVTAFLDRLT